MTQAKSPRTTGTDSDSLVMSPEAMGRPSMTVTDIGQCNGFNKILCVKEKSTCVAKILLTWFDEMEPLLWTDSTNSRLSNQMAPILAGFTRLTPHLVG